MGRRVATRIDTLRGHLWSNVFQSLHKALYKPAAFFKGILLPLCDVSFIKFFDFFVSWIQRYLILNLNNIKLQNYYFSRVHALSVRQLSSVPSFRKHPFPCSIVLLLCSRYGSVAFTMFPKLTVYCKGSVLQIAEMEYTGASSYFLRMLIDKKYALPYKALDALVSHFLRYE